MDLASQGVADQMIKHLSIRARLVSLTLLLLFVGLLTLTVITALRYERVEQRLNQVTTENAVWSAAQTELELSRFLTTLDGYMLGFESVGKADVLLRFDLLWSRMELFKSGTLKREIAEIEGHDDLVARLEQVLVDVEADLRLLDRTSLQAFERIRAAFDPFTNQLRDLTLASLKWDIDQRLKIQDQMTSMLNQMGWFSGLAIVSLCSLIGFLFYYEMRTNRLLRQTLEAQETVVAARRRLSDAVENINEGFLLCDQDDNVVMWNSKMEQICPVSAQALKQGVPYIDVLRYGAVNNEFDLEGRPLDDWLDYRRVARMKTAATYEMKLTDGRWIRVSDRHTEDGGIVSIRSDITEMKRREGELEDARTKLSHQARELARMAEEADAARDVLDDAVNSLDESLVMFDATDRLQLFNRRFRDLYGDLADRLRHGITYEEVIRLAVDAGIYPPPDDVEALIADRMKKRRAALMSEEVHFRHQEPTGDGRWIQISTQRTRAGGMVSVFTDITEAKRRTLEIQSANERLEVQATQLKALAEEAQAASKAKSEFLSMISHEIRTPMNAILGFASLLSDSELTTDQRRFIAEIQQSGHRLLGLISDTIDYSELDAGGMKLETSPFNLHRMARQSIRLAQDAVGSREVQVELKLDPELPKVYLGDLKRLTQVLTHLMSNATKFTQKGRIILSIEEVETHGPRHKLRFTVHDSGSGIPLDIQKTLFRPFERKRQDRDITQPGVGLGLVICKRLLDLMGGEIGFESTVGYGSSFWFEVTLEQSDGTELEEMALLENLNAGQQNNEPTLNSEPISLHVLVVEDTTASQLVIKTALEKRGHMVTTARDGQEALDAIERRDFDLILMDMQMPTMDGMTATRKIRALKGPQARVPIYALSAQVMDSDKKAAFAAGLNGYLTKPIIWEELDAVLRVTSRNVARAAEDHAFTQATPQDEIDQLPPEILPPLTEEGKETTEPDVFALPNGDWHAELERLEAIVNGQLDMSIAEEGEAGVPMTGVTGSKAHDHTTEGVSGVELDLQSLEDMVDAVGEDVFSGLLDTFFSNSEDLFEQFDAALHAQDWDQVRKTAHRFAGLLSQFGAHMAARQASAIEVEPNTDTINDLASDFLQCARKSVSELKKLPYVNRELTEAASST